MSRLISIHPVDPQMRMISQVVAALRNGDVIVYPTDSGYALGCTLDNKKAFERVCRIRNVDKKHNFTLVCPGISEASKYVSVDNEQFRLIRGSTPGPYTFILKALKSVPSRVMQEKKRTIGIRIPDSSICMAMLAELGEPIMSTTLILPGNAEAEHDPYEIRDALDYAVDFIVDGGYLTSQPTTVIDMSEDEYVLVREGAGDPSVILG
ncbi:MAG: threonylcarbamoyl-AMP synthase [Succinivibrionaceae bacterium]|nr:threonylcarbamoyl-AMP synthase [Succinivibrionaceae bacterium]